MARRIDRLPRVARALERWNAVSEEKHERISSSQGYFADAQVAPSVPRLFSKVGIEIRSYGLRHKSRFDGEWMEFDILAVGRRSGDGGPVVVVVEVSAQLVVRDVDWCLAKLPRFFDFFPQHRDHELIGAVAGMVVKGDVLAYAESQGLVVLGPGEEVARWMNRKGFVPKVWRAGGGR